MPAFNTNQSIGWVLAPFLVGHFRVAVSRMPHQDGVVEVVIVDRAPERVGVTELAEAAT